MTETLCELYAATGGPNWTYACDAASVPNSTSYCWCGASADPCSWWQVECTGAVCNDSAIRSIQLVARTGLMGSLPPTLGFELASLLSRDGGSFVHLSIQQEPGLGGDIAALRGLTTLTTLQLTGTSVVSSVSALNELLQHNGGLEHLDLSAGAFRGPLPASLALLSGLRIATLANNGFTGNLSAFDFESVTTGLQHLDLSSNRLTGGIPPLPGAITSLILSDNKLTGTLPAQFSKLFNLTRLSLSDNNFFGNLTNLRMCRNASASSCLTTDPENPAGTTVLTSLRLHNNAFEGDLDQVFENVIFQSSDLDVEMRFPLFELDLSSNRFSGRLTMRVSQAGSLGLRRLDVTLNPAMDRDALFPSFLSPQPSTQIAYIGNFVCPVYRDAASFLIVAADASVMQFTNCSCERGFFGSPRYECAACVEGAICNGGDELKLRPGLFPVSLKQSSGADYYTLTGLERCDVPDACNPSGNYTYTWNLSTVASQEFCGYAYENRLCSQCRPGFYQTSLGCETCGALWDVTYYAVLSIVFVVNLVLFVMTPCVTVRTGSNGFAKVVFVLQVALLCGGVAMSIVPGLGSWYSDAILLLLVVQLDDTWAEVAGEGNGSVVQSCQNIMLFFLQSTVILNVRFWTIGGWNAARWVVFSLQFVNLGFRGLLSCTSLSGVVLPDTWASVLLTLLTPVGLFAVCVVLAAFAKVMEDAAISAEARKRRRLQLQQRVPHKLVLLEESAGDEEGLALQDELPKEEEEEEEEGARPSMLDRLASVGLRIANAAYFQLCVSVFSNLGCTSDSIDGQRYSRLFPFVECDARHQALEWSLSGPFLLYVVGIPVVFWLLLRFKRRAKYLRFITLSYRKGFEWYELLFFLRRLLLAISIGVAPEGLSHLLIGMILLAAISAQFLLQSFARPIINWLDVLSMCAVAVTHSQIAVVATGTPESNLAPLVIVTILNIGFFVVLSLVLLSASWQSFAASREKDDEAEREVQEQ